LDVHMAFWQKAIDTDYSRLALPFEQSVSSSQVAFARVDAQLDAGQVAALKGFCEQRDLSVFMLLITAFQLLLKRLAAAEGVNIGFPVSGRERLEWQDMVGVFVNTLVLSQSLDDSESFSSLLQRNRRKLVDMFEHQALPFEKVLEAFELPRD